MEITKEWLKEQSACQDGYEWSLKVLNNKPMLVETFLKTLMKEDKYDWSNWVIVRVMTYDQYVSYAVFTAEQVIDIYERQYPDDKRPRLAIEAAKKCIGLKGDDAGAARAAARDAARAAAGAAAGAAAWAADRAAAGAAAWAATRAAAGVVAWVAARAAAGAAGAAAGAAAWAATRDAAGAAGAAAGVAAWAAAKKQMQIKILEYGIGLIKKG